MKRITCPYCRTNRLDYKREKGFKSYCDCGAYLTVLQIMTEEELSMFNKESIPNFPIKVSTIVWYKDGDGEMYQDEEMIPISCIADTEVE